ncbi:MAG: hypothetical protein KDB29_03385, partial [Planctomycetes bacterium]|nr:hypothetical protein [Planctomycetota bacterium]
NPLLVTEMPDQRMALPANFEGSYYATANVVSYVGPDEATVYTIPATPGRPLMRIRFHWISGQSNLEYLGPFAKRHP